MSSKLVLDNISFGYPDDEKLLFENLNFTLQSDEIVSIIGISGSGKSTIVQLLNGYLIPNNGIVYIDDAKNLVNQPNSSIITVFQDYKFSVFPWLNVEDNIKLGWYKNRPKENINLNELMDILFKDYKSEHDILKQYPNDLSGGQNQRIQIAKAIYSQSKFIILDEATSSLDVNGKERIKDVLIRINDKYECGILVITHDLDFATNISSKILILENKKLTKFTDTNIQTLKEKLIN